jgi:hypothetical protein
VLKERFTMSMSMYLCGLSYGADTTRPGQQTLRHQLIECRDYERWRAKGCPAGTALQDWLEAEAELHSEFEMDSWSPLCRIRLPAGAVSR